MEHVEHDSIIVNRKETHIKCMIICWLTNMSFMDFLVCVIALWRVINDYE